MSKKLVTRSKEISLNTKVSDLIAQLQAEIRNLPEDTILDYCSGDCYTEFYIQWKEEETDEEYQSRLDIERRYTENITNRELAQLAVLQAKYGKLE